MQTNTETKKDLGIIIKDALKELKETLIAFIKAPRALWGINIPYIIEGLCYFGLIFILTVYSSENVKLNDIASGLVVGGVTWGITFAMLFLGGVVDRIGVRNALAGSLALMAVGRFFAALSGTLPLGTGLWSPMFFMLTTGLLIMVIGYGIYQPAAYAGVKRYTNPQTAAMGYAVIYALMNLGGFIFGPISSFTRQNLTNIFPPNGLAGVIWILAALTIISSLLTLLIIRKKVDQAAVDRVKKETEQLQKSDTKKLSAKENESKSALPKRKINNKFLILWSLIAVASVIIYILVQSGKLEIHPALPVSVLILSFILTIYDFLRNRPDHPFRDGRFSFFIFILIPVQTLFAHQWLTIPLYLKRAFSGSLVSEYFEVFGNLNPLLIFILAPIIAGLTARTKVYKMMIWGTIVMAVPTFLLAIGTNAYFYLLYVLFMTLGEAMWQPRFLQWIAEIAPEGKTGIYMGIGQFPWFLTKMVTSFYSGYFLQNFIPDPAFGLSSNPEFMWFIYGLIAIISPVALIIARKWMVKGMKEKAM
ncbi:MAG: MFS transporter [Calditrichaceae bacterium]|nr:MFS transporter [Calditrichaceae bacterium]